MEHPVYCICDTFNNNFNDNNIHIYQYSYIWPIRTREGERWSYSVTLHKNKKGIPPYISHKFSVNYYKKCIVGKPISHVSAVS